MLSPSKTIPKSPSFNSVSELHLVDAAWLEVSDAKVCVLRASVRAIALRVSCTEPMPH